MAGDGCPVRRYRRSVRRAGRAAGGYAVFAADTTIRALADPAGQVEHWSDYDSGGHFPAMETPTLLVGDIRAFFSGLR